jgi:hypothetical protein
MSHTTPATDNVVNTTTAPSDRLRAAAREIQQGGVNALVEIVKRNQVLSIASLCTALLFFAGLGPQVQSTHHIAMFGVSVGTVQTHPVVPGWVYVLLALGCGAGLVQFVRTAVPEWLMVTRLASGLSAIGAIIALLQRAVESQVGLGGAGWGYYLALLSTFVLVFVSRVLWSRARREALASAAAESATAALQQ